MWSLPLTWSQLKVLDEAEEEEGGVGTEGGEGTEEEGEEEEEVEEEEVEEEGGEGTEEGVEGEEEEEKEEEEEEEKEEGEGRSLISRCLMATGRVRTQSKHCVQVWYTKPLNRSHTGAMEIHRLDVL